MLIFHTFQNLLCQHRNLDTSNRRAHLLKAFPERCCRRAILSIRRIVNRRLGIPRFYSSSFLLLLKNFIHLLFRPGRAKSIRKPRMKAVGSSALADSLALARFARCDNRGLHHNAYTLAKTQTDEMGWQFGFVHNPRWI